MANTIKVKRGTDANRAGVTPAEGELLYTTDTKKVYVGDGSTAGGNEVGGGGGSSQTPAELLADIKTVDGSGSGLDADLLDGQQGSYYAAASSLSNYTPLDHIRSLGVPRFTNGTDPNITTAQVIAEIESDGGFDSYTSAFKTSWSYAGNYNLTDAGRFTETAGTAWLTWTDNSSDTTRGNITALAIAPNTGGSAGRVFIYNDQGSSYSPGWREVWTSTSDGSGSGLDADLLDGVQGSGYVTTSTQQTISNIKLFLSETKFGSSYVDPDSGVARDAKFGTNGIAVSGGIKTDTLNGGTPWTSANDGTGSGLDADLLDGYHASTTRNAANTIPIRDANGYLNLGWINTTSGNTTSTVTDVYVNTNDGYIRKATPAHFRSQITDGVYQPAGTYNTIIGTDTDINTSGSTIIDNIYVTDGVITSMGTRTLTAADIGALTTSGKAADSDLLDGLNSGSFLRSDAAVAKTSGLLRFNDNVFLTFGTGDDAELFSNGSHLYLDLNNGIGNFYIRDGATTRFTFDDAGSFTATGNITAYSDRRLKDDIQQIEGAVGKVQQLSGNTYTRNDLPDTERRYAGVIAQEVEAVLPEAVSEAEDGTKTVDYNATIALLIEAVKELSAKVEKLEASK